MPWFRHLPVLGLLLLAACAQPAPRPGVSTAALGAVTPQPVDAAETAIAARLQELGFDLVESRETGVIQAQMQNGAPAAWSVCDRVLVTERDDRNRSHWADANDRRTTVTVRFSQLAGQTSVTLTPRFTGVYLDRFDNLPFDRACASTGALEPQILAALTPPES
jgi:hypothetical protein